MTRRASFALAVAIALGSRASFAQPAQPAQPSAAPAPAPAPSAQDDARMHVSRGYELFDAGDFRLALVEFERAYAIAPSTKILYNLGQVHLELGQYARAHAALERYLREGGADVPADRRAAVENDLAAIRKRIATLTVESSAPDAEVSVDDQPLGKAPVVRAIVDAGELRVRVASPGFAPETRLLKLAGGDDVSARFDLARLAPVVVAAPPLATAPMPAPAARDEGLPTPAVVGFVATGVLAAGALGTGIGALAASSRFDEMRRTPIDGSPEQASADLRRQGNLADALAITTDALIVSAVVAGGISLWLTLHDRARHRSEP